jgi:hypothetical protein
MVVDLHDATWLPEGIPQEAWSTWTDRNFQYVPRLDGAGTRYAHIHRRQTLACLFGMARDGRVIDVAVWQDGICLAAWTRVEGAHPRDFSWTRVDAKVTR